MSQYKPAFHVYLRNGESFVRIGDTVTTYAEFIAKYNTYAPPSTPFDEEYYSPYGDAFTDDPVHYYSDGVSQQPAPLPYIEGDAYIADESYFANLIVNEFPIPDPTQADAQSALDGVYKDILDSNIARNGRLFDAVTGASFINTDEVAAYATLQANYASLNAQIPGLATVADIQTFLEDLRDNLLIGITLPLPTTTGSPVFAGLGSNGRIDAIYQWLNQTGQVKVNGANGIKPIYNLTNNYVEQVFSYGAGPLNIAGFPTTTWPGNIASPADSDFYDSVNQTLLENTVPGQVHEWRINWNYSNKGAANRTNVRFRIYNTLSGFSQSQENVLGTGTTSGQGLTSFKLTADPASLPPPFGTGQGYNLALSADSPITVEIDSITRYSLTTTTG